VIDLVRTLGLELVEVRKMSGPAEDPPST
jgi:hypothetical protein